MCIAGKEGLALGRNVCARRLATFRQKATRGGFNVRVERRGMGGGRKGRRLIRTKPCIVVPRRKPISYAFKGQIISPFYGPLKYKSSSKLNSSLRTPTSRTITSIL